MERTPTIKTARDFCDWTTARRVGFLANADPRTVDRVILGKPTRPSVRFRILAVLLDLGILPPWFDEPAVTTKGGQP